jgi:hypothetical protein
MFASQDIGKNCIQAYRTISVGLLNPKKGRLPVGAIRQGMRPIKNRLRGAQKLP